MATRREIADRIAKDFADFPSAWGRKLADAIDEALRQRDERAVTRFIAIVKDIKGPNVPRVDLYEAMLQAGRELLRRNDKGDTSGNKSK